MQDEGFLVLMVGIALAERIISSKHKSERKRDSFEKCGSRLLNISETDFTAFWNMYRNGMMHHAHPFSGTFQQGDDTHWDWDISGNYSGLPRIITVNAKEKVIRISPWKWLDIVVCLYDAYPTLIDLGDSRKLGTVHTVPENSTLIPPNTLPGQTPNMPPPDLRTGSALE